MVDTIKHYIPIKRLLDELGISSSDPTIVHQDNKSTITIAKNGEGYNGKARAMRVRYGLIKELVDSNEIRLNYLPTKEMMADCLSKPNCATTFAANIKAIGVMQSLENNIK